MQVYQRNSEKEQRKEQYAAVTNTKKISLKIQTNDLVIYLLLQINSHLVMKMWTDNIYLLYIHDF